MWRPMRLHSVGKIVGQTSLQDKNVILQQPHKMKLPGVEMCEGERHKALANAKVHSFGLALAAR